MNLSLGSRDENIVDETDGLLQADGSLVHIFHVLQPHLIVQERLEERDRGPPSPVHVPLAVTNRVVAVEIALALVIQPAQDVGDVVGEESLVVEHGAHHLGHGRGGHGLVVVVAVALHPHLGHLAECEDVTPTSSGAQYGLVRETMQLRLFPRQNGVAGGGELN